MACQVNHALAREEVRINGLVISAKAAIQQQLDTQVTGMST